MLEELVSATNRQTREATFDRLKAALTVHNATEENLVYPALAVAAGKKPAAQHLYHETAEADTLVFELDTMLKEDDDADFGAKAEMLQDAILDHVDEEESSAFPDLEENTDEEQQQQLYESVVQFRNEFHFAPSPA